MSGEGNGEQRSDHSEVENSTDDEQGRSEEAFLVYVGIMNVSQEVYDSQEACHNVNGQAII